MIREDVLLGSDLFSAVARRKHVSAYTALTAFSFQGKYVSKTGAHPNRLMLLLF